MPFLSAEEKTRLTAAIQQAESGTRGEIVTVIAQRSDSYRYIPMLWAALGALSVPGVYFAWVTLTTRGWIEPLQISQSIGTLYTVQVLVFLGLGMLLQLPSIRLRVVPQTVKQQRAARHAREQFVRQNVHNTESRCGILIFVSVDEHYVEILADTGIASITDTQQWQQIVDQFIEQVRQGHIATGFENTIEQCREMLWAHFPADSEKARDELPNHLIEIESGD